MRAGVFGVCLALCFGMTCGLRLSRGDEVVLSSRTLQIRADRADMLRKIAADKVTIYHGGGPQTTWYMWPEETTCKGVLGVHQNYAIDRMGQLTPDGSKWMCNAKALKQTGGKCLVYSFGGHTEYDWDEAMVNTTGCEHHIFDFAAPCMEPGKEKESCQPFAEIYGPELKRKGVTDYHNYGIGVEDGDFQWFKNKLPVKSLETIMQMLGHQRRRIDVLKLDVEGAEWDVMPSILSSGIEIGQMNIELHWPRRFSWLETTDDKQVVHTMHDHFFKKLEDAGFAMAHVEFNIACGFNCIEAVWVNRRLYPENLE